VSEAVPQVCDSGYVPGADIAIKALRVLEADTCQHGRVHACRAERAQGEHTGRTHRADPYRRSRTREVLQAAKFASNRRAPRKTSLRSVTWAVFHRLRSPEKAAAPAKHARKDCTLAVFQALRSPSKRSAPQKVRSSDSSEPSSHRPMLGTCSRQAPRAPDRLGRGGDRPEARQTHLGEAGAAAEEAGQARGRVHLGHVLRAHRQRAAALEGDPRQRVQRAVELPARGRPEAQAAPVEDVQDLLRSVARIAVRAGAGRGQLDGLGRRQREVQRQRACRCIVSADVTCCITRPLCCLVLDNKAYILG
jgi:hypothetical protein